MTRTSLLLGALITLLAPRAAEARLSRLEILDVLSPTFEGVSFSATGTYERLKARAHGELDPFDPRNAVIVNLAKAPRNASGMVEYAVDVYLLKPVDLSRGNGGLYVEAPNRGDKRALGLVNSSAGGNDPHLAADAGTGFLMNQGFTIVWSAWQGDVTPGNERMLASFPVATSSGQPIVGLSREEYFDTGTASDFIANLTYPAASPSATLTVRQNEADARQVPPDLTWSFLSDLQIKITRPAGFDSGALYELTYTARDPVVMGIGFAAVRDVVSFLRNEASDAAGTPNPLFPSGVPAIDHTIGFGHSQAGRFLRDFLYQGFNEDEDGQRVFDGLNPHVAGSKRSFTNYEFGQPNRNPQQHNEHLFPGDQFPFTYETLTDALTGETGGLLDRCRASGTCPKLVQTDTDLEMWQSRASLVVSDAGGAPVGLPPEVRAYSFASAPHVPAATPAAGICQELSNPLDYRPMLRAITASLDAWITLDRPPPASRYPSISDGTLVPPDQASTGFPVIPGVTYLGLVNGLSVRDFSVQPPAVSAAYPVLVSPVDSDGNAIAGIRHPDLEVPTATYMGWNLRAAGHAQNGLCGNTGSYVPFARTLSERLLSGDPRPSLEERYATHRHYVSEVMFAARHLMRERFLLREDAERIIEAAMQSDVGSLTDVSEEAREEDLASIAVGQRIQDEDVAVCRSVQRGLARPPTGASWYTWHARRKWIDAGPGECLVVAACLQVQGE